MNENMRQRGHEVAPRVQGQKNGRTVRNDKDPKID